MPFTQSTGVTDNTNDSSVLVKYLSQLTVTVCPILGPWNGISLLKFSHVLFYHSHLCFIQLWNVKVWWKSPFVEVTLLWLFLNENTMGVFSYGFKNTLVHHYGKPMWVKGEVPWWLIFVSLDFITKVMFLNMQRLQLKHRDHRENFQKHLYV